MDKWKIKASIKVLNTALKIFHPKLALAWTGGKDSTVILHMLRSVGAGKVTVPLMFINTGLHFPETMQFVDTLAREWQLNLIRVTDKHSLKAFRQTKSQLKRREIARLLKIRAIKRTVKKKRWRALIVGIRWDEHQARASEVYFSRRNNHMRVHPILHFSEQDVWDYIKEYQVPYNPLYDQGYRSLGEKPFTKPVLDKSAAERSGREKEKEIIMSRLRALGYF